jgi:hypothetical protein
VLATNPDPIQAPRLVVLKEREILAELFGIMFP